MLKLVNGKFPLWHILQILFEYWKYVYFNIHDYQILHNITNSWIFSNIGRNCLLGNRKKIAKFLMRTFTCHSTFLYASRVLYYVSIPSDCAGLRAQSTYITVRGQSYFSRLPKYWPPSPSPPGECVPPAFVAGGGQTRRAERGMGGQYFGRRNK
jgi:hypothetical protein